MVWRGMVAQERHLRLTAVPRLVHRQLVQQRDPRVGDVVAAREVVQLRLAGERADRAVAGARPAEVYASQLVTLREMHRTVVGDARTTKRECFECRQIA